MKSGPVADPMAVPLAVLIVIVVGNELGFDRLAVNIAMFPSITSTLFMDTLGTISSFKIVPVPNGFTFDVLPEVTIPLSVNVSFGSLIGSGVVSTLTIIDVCPAGIVIVVGKIGV